MANLKLQADLARVQKELATGRLADVGLALGIGSTEAMKLRQTQAWQEAVTASNALAAVRLDASQLALDGIRSVAQDFLGQLLSAKGSSSAAIAAVGQVAKSALGALAGQLNSEAAGVSLFSGTKSDQRAMVDYFSPSGSSARQGVDDAFQTAFGMSRNDPAMSTIGANAMRQFTKGAYADLFSDEKWGASWSNASSRTTETRVSASEKIEVGVSANEAAFRSLARAYVMVADLGASKLSTETANVILDEATTVIGTALAGVGELQGRLGTSQQRVAAVTDRLQSEGAMAASRLAKLEQVDPYVSTTALNTLTTQLQASYAATARIEHLSILNYL